MVSEFFVFLGCCLKTEATETDLAFFFTATTPSVSGGIWRLCAFKPERLISMLMMCCMVDGSVFWRCSEVRGLLGSAAVGLWMVRSAHGRSDATGRSARSDARYEPNWKKFE